MHPRECSPYVAIDCEMVGVGAYGLDSALARVTVIDWWGGILLDSYVKQSQPVTDYRTFVSGVTQENLQKASLSLRECRQLVKELIRGRILVGHGLKKDLNALGLSHPLSRTRDTAQYKPFMQTRHDGQLWPRKLKDLVKEILGQEIQVLGRPHSSCEDALAAMNLYKKVRAEWERALRLSSKQQQQQWAKQQQTHRNNQMADQMAAHMQYQQMVYQKNAIMQQQRAHQQALFHHNQMAQLQYQQMAYWHQQQQQQLRTQNPCTYPHGMVQ